MWHNTTVGKKFCLYFFSSKSVKKSVERGVSLTRVKDASLTSWNLSTIRFRARKWWNECMSEFSIEFNVELVHGTLRGRIKKLFWNVWQITKEIYPLSLNNYNKAWLNTNLAKTPNLFTVEFQELPLLQIFWETYRFNSREIFSFTCIHTLRLQKCGFQHETGFFRL